MRIPADAISAPLRIYASAKKSDGEPSSYAVHAGGMHVLSVMLDTLGVSKAQLAQLLGYPSNSNGQIYRHFQGKDRPSQKYLLRGYHLLFLANAGVPLHRARLIDWNNGYIHWKNGKASYSDPKSGDWGGIPTPENAETFRPLVPVNVTVRTYAS